MKIDLKLLGLALLYLLASTADLVAKRPAPEKYFSEKSVLALVEASAAGNVRKIDAAIKAGANVNARGIDGWVPLAYAMLSMNKEGFTALLDRGADPNVEFAGSPGVSTSLVGLAAQADDTFWLSEMIKHGADINVKTSYGGAPPIVIAMLHNRLANVRVLIDAKADLEIKAEPLEDTPVLRAAMMGKWEAAHILLEAGADWRTRLKNDRGIVDLLQTYSANKNIDRNSTFWQWRTKTAQWLKEHGAEIPDELIAGK